MSEKTRLVGSRIRLIRVSRRLPQKDVAEQVGISQAHMSNIECDRSHCTLDNLIRLSEVLGCPLRDFFVDIDGRVDMPKPEKGLFSLADLAEALLQLKR